MPTFNKKQAWLTFVENEKHLYKINNYYNKAKFTNTTSKFVGTNLLFNKFFILSSF